HRSLGRRGLPLRRAPCHREQRGVVAVGGSMPVALVRWTDDQRSRRQRYLAVGLSADSGLAAHDQELLAAGMRVPERDGTIVEVHEGGIRVVVGWGGVQHLELDRTGEASAVQVLAVPTGDDLHRSTTGLRMRPMPEISVSTTSPACRNRGGLCA